MNEAAWMTAFRGIISFLRMQGHRIPLIMRGRAIFPAGLLPCDTLFREANDR